MSYSVVETQRKGRINDLTAVPEGWIDKENNLVYWPRNGFETIRADENSKFELNWMPKIILKIRHTQLDIKVAEEMVDYYVKKSESESEIVPETDEEVSRRKRNLVAQKKSLPQKMQYTLSSPNVNVNNPPVSRILHLKLTLNVLNQLLFSLMVCFLLFFQVAVVCNATTAEIGETNRQW